MSVLDRLTGRVPMYRVVTLGLLVLLAAAIVLSAIGILFYPPLDLVVSAAVAVGSTWGATRLLGIAFGVRPHDESSVITGLLLFFLFLPTLDPVGLSVIALAGAIAAASKFLLVRRRRHLFNPAAIAAFVVGLTGLGAAGWWVATPALAPLVAVLAVLIVARTRTVATATVFTVLAFALVVVQLLPFSADPLTAAGLALGSYPVLFLAGFLLTEPQTLPPRRWQRITVAVVVAALFAAPITFGFSVGTFYLSPEFALVAGNAVAALLALPTGARLTYADRHQITPDVAEFVFTPDRPLRILPGQYVELDLPHAKVDRRGRRRHLTVVGKRSNEVRVAVRTSEGGSSFKRALAALQPGDTVRLTSVGGDFVLPLDTRTRVLLAAGGIGITPFVRQLEADAEAGIDRNVVLVLRAADAEQAPYLRTVARLCSRVILVTPDPPVEPPANVAWAPSLDEAFARVEGLTGRRVYASGSPSFLAQARAALRAAGVRRMTTDMFSGY